MLISKRIASVLFFLLLVGQLCGQHDVKDSLEVLLKTQLDARTRVDVLNQLSYQYYDFNDSIAFSHARSALALALKQNYKKGIKYAYTMVGLGYSSQSKYKEAIINYRISDNIKVSDAQDNSVYNIMLLGSLYRDVAKFDSALLMYNQAKVISIKSDKSYLPNIYKNIASVNVILWKNHVAIKYLDSATSLPNYKPKPNDYVVMDIMSLYGQAYQNLLEFDKSKDYFDKMCKSAFELEDYYHQITCKLNQAHLSYNHADFTGALRICFEGLQLSKKYTFPPQYVKLLIQIGEVYVGLSQFDIASQYFYQALRLSELNGLDFQTGEIYSELAWINKDQKNYRAALEYADKSQAIREKIGDRKGVANSRNVRGLVYLLLKDYNKSILEHEAALKIREDIGHTEGIAASIYNMSLVYEELNQIEKSIDLQKRAIAIEENIDNKLSVAISYNGLSVLLIKTGNLKEAMSYLEKANLLGQETKSVLLLRNNALNYVSYYEATKDYKKGLHYQKLYQSLNDSIYSEASAIKLAEVEALYNVEKNEQEIELLSQRQLIHEDQIKLQQSQLTQKNIIIISAVLGLLLISVAGLIGYQYYREKSRSNLKLIKLNTEMIEQREEIQAQSEELIEANQTIAQINKGLEEKVEYRTSELKQAYKELDTFFYRSSHDFRRPLTTFMGLAEVAKITVKDNNAIELFEKVRETAHNLDKMLMKLQSISDMGSQQLIYKEVFLEEILNEVLDNFRSDLTKHNIHGFVEVDLKEPFISYPALIRVIIQNLVENAIHFCRVKDSFVRINISRQDDHMKLIVKDNGQGIDEEYHNRIFEMYFRANQNSKGNGLGLYIVKKAVEKLAGSISFSSKPGEGSTFIVMLPFEQKSVDFN